MPPFAVPDFEPFGMPVKKSRREARRPVGRSDLVLSLSPRSDPSWRQSQRAEFSGTTGLGDWNLGGRLIESHRGQATPSGYRI